MVKFEDNNELKPIVWDPEAINFIPLTPSFVSMLYNEWQHYAEEDGRSWQKFLEDRYPSPLQEIETVPAPVAPGERTTFIKALEEAFWQAGGPKLLKKLADDNPLEFIKVCAKLIPIDAANKGPSGGISITFNVLPEEPVEQEAGDIIDEQ